MLFPSNGCLTNSLLNVCSWVLQRGTALLLEHLTGSLAGTISVSTHLDIAPQHHLFMKGRNGSNIKHITQRTGAQIHFPDPNSPQKKSTVYIQGTIESVCLARQYLMVGDPSTRRSGSGRAAACVEAVMVSQMS